MEILSSITSQIAAVGLPLYAVTLTALRRPDTPLLLLLHWHGYRRELQWERWETRPVPGSALQINAPWTRLEDIDKAMLEAAWQLGAWDMERRDRRPWFRVGAPAREAMECRQSFGDNPFVSGDDSHLLAEAPDRGELMRLAATKGYVRWLFRPVRGGVWQETAEDDTLEPDGSRVPPCPVAPRSGPGGSGQAQEGRTVYRLGRVSRLVVVGG